jgi:hypothetical protein
MVFYLPEFIYLISLDFCNYFSSTLRAFVIFKVHKKGLVDFLDELSPRTWLLVYIVEICAIFRLYLTDCTGRNTLKPGWVDWLEI